MSRLGDATDASTTGNWWDNLVPALRDVYLTFDARERSNKAFEINAQRIAQGLPPYDFGPLLQQTQPGVQIGVSQDVKTLAMVLGLGALGVALYAASRRRR